MTGDPRSIGIRGNLLAAIALVALVTAACAGGTTAPLTTPAPAPSSPGTLDCPFAGGCGTSSVPSTSSTTATTTGLANVTAGTAWVDATGNLAGLTSSCGAPTLVAANPHQDLLIAGVAGHGLWTSKDGAQTWATVPGSAAIANRPSSITFDPDHQGTFWGSALYTTGGAVYETADGGATLQQLGTGRGLTNSSDYVSIDLSDPSRRTLLAVGHEGSFLYRSVDGGSTWANLSSSLPASVGWTLAASVVDARTYLVGTAGGSASGIYRSSDGGSTWSRVYPSGVAGPALSTGSGGATIYWVLASGALVVSTDHGSTWQVLSQVQSSHGSLIELPNGWLGVVAQYVYVSPDHGQTWQAVGPALPFAASGMTYSPSRRALYAWRSDCANQPNATAPLGTIVRLDVAFGSQ